MHYVYISFQVFNIQPDGKVFLNRIYSQLPLSIGNI